MIDDGARQRAIDTAHAGHPIGSREFALILRLGISAFYKKAKIGTYDDFLLRPALGPKRYSGVLVSRWLRGEVLEAPQTFGRRRRA